jgi:hypothetical protein
MIRITVGLFVAATLMFGWNNANAFSSMAKVTIKVVDEEGQPMAGANVGVGFENSKNWQTQVTGQTGTSDADGKFSAQGGCNGHISYGADMNRYYDCNYVYDFKKAGLLGWEPRNPELTVVLRKIGKQVPMYARDTDKSRITIPKIDKDIGFDLVKFDWVAPYGSGVISDFVFNLKTHLPSLEEYSYDLRLRFQNELDGIIPIEEDLQYGSVFKLPREAPLAGYQGNKEIFARRKNYVERSRKENRSYIFRVRSLKDESGNIQGMYGKIIGDFDIGTRIDETADIIFKYYFNPDGTRNLEYDPSSNLFGKLPRRERVGIK